jgi:NO-binding membrane sensor protein with MHYT domain
MIEYGHNGLLVFLSLLVALVAGFTGLSLTKDLSSKSFSQRKIAVALASFALGGGIWSMHFVAMLGLQMPILFYYDAAITLVSALIAILLVAVALGLLHFTNRTACDDCRGRLYYGDWDFGDALCGHGGTATVSCGVYCTRFANRIHCRDVHVYHGLSRRLYQPQ